MSQKCVTSLLTRLEQNLPPNICIACLQAFRIFSREKTHMESLTSERSLRLLMRIAGIEYYTTEHGENVTIQNGNQDGKKQLMPPTPVMKLGGGGGRYIGITVPMCHCQAIFLSVCCFCFLVWTMSFELCPDVILCG